MYVCASTQEVINNYWRDLDLVRMIGLIIPAASQFQFIAITIDVMHGHEPSNEMSY